MENNLLNIGELNRLPVKEKVNKLVEYYIHTFADEFSIFENEMKMRNEQTMNRAGAIRGIDYVNRRVVETPETLYYMFVKYLTPDEHKWLYSVDDKKHEGIRWFARNYPVFRTVDKI